MNRNPILEVKDLEVEFGKGKNRFKAVDGVSFNIYKGETFGLVGESGSGKTTIGRAIIRLNEVSNGEIIFEGEDISGKLSREKERNVKKNIQMIFQDPMASLNERAKVDYIISEGLLNLNKKKSKKEINKEVHNALLNVGLLPEFASRFPHEFSGGQRQRIGIARSLIMEPKFIIADEPISALDVSIRAQVLNLLLELQKRKKLTYLFIAHDLSVVKFITDRVAVIYKGKIVEMAPTEKLFKNPLHPYTISLISAIPLPDPIREKNKRLKIYDSKIHNYIENPPKWIEIEPEHFVLANEMEITKYRKRLK
ncbi:ATP-binding cassette domain-containing protein [Tissierella creatinophila]|uniref:Oligopeptide transport ATP-binding protein OppF n=1 Tax=Tissierella creatinophila DSM 6911 TaxID=1123403 RepID=A0A1U7M686_TISCR|nr:ATP-binding cassette domain-containing protein [Tissierella creatinophila]OLS02817.1 oligopeptide transport ATP-binding protein OppF [Tissierella creatinophila DSM 6911]